MKKIAFLLMIALLALGVVGCTRPGWTGAWFTDSETVGVDIEVGTWTSPLLIPPFVPMPVLEIPAPIAPVTSCALTAEPTSGTVPLSVQFNADIVTTEGYTGILDYVWNFGEETMRNGGTSQSHTYEEAGFYWISFTVMGEAEKLCTARVGISASEVPPPSVNYEVSYGCNEDGTGFVGINAGNTWVRGSFASSKEKFDFDLDAGELAIFQIERILYLVEPWVYIVESPEGIEKGDFSLGACLDIGLVSCIPDWEDKLGRAMNDYWYAKAHGSGAIALRLLTSWREPLIWEESGQSDLGKVEINSDGTWSIDVSIPGPEDGKGQIEVLGVDNVWHGFTPCSFAGEVFKPETWLDLWPAGKQQGIRAGGQGGFYGSFEETGWWRADNVRIAWWPCYIDEEAEGDQEICGAHLVTPIPDQNQFWLAGTVTGFYPGMGTSHAPQYLPTHIEQVSYEGDKERVYDAYVLPAGSMSRYRFGRFDVDFILSDEVPVGAHFYIRVMFDWKNSPENRELPGVWLRNHRVVKYVIIGADDRHDPATLERYDPEGWCFNPYHLVGYQPRSGNIHVPEPHYSIDGFEVRDLSWGGSHDPGKALPTWEIDGKGVELYGEGGTLNSAP